MKIADNWHDFRNQCRMYAIEHPTSRRPDGPAPLNFLERWVLALLVSAISLAFAIQIARWIGR